MLIISIIIISLLYGFYSNVYSNKTDIYLELEKVSGDEKYIKDISIKGDIVDENRKISFSILNGEISKEIKYGLFGSYNYNNNDNEYKNSNSTYVIETNNGKYFLNEYEKWTGIYKSAEKTKDNKFIDIEPVRVLLIENINTYKAIDNKIILFTIKENKIYADIFDTVSNTIISEFEINESLGTYSSIVNNGYCILINHLNEENRSNKYYVIDVVNNKVVEEASIIEDYRSWYTVKSVQYKNNILYIFECYGKKISQSKYEQIVEISAYQNGDLKYEGQIKSNVNNEAYYDHEIYNKKVRQYINLRME